MTPTRSRRARAGGGMRVQGETKGGSPCAISAITEGRCEDARQLLSCLIPGAGGRLRRLLGPLFRGKLLLHLRVTAPVSFG